MATVVLLPFSLVLCKSNKGTIPCTIDIVQVRQPFQKPLETVDTKSLLTILQLLQLLSTLYNCCTCDVRVTVAAASAYVLLLALLLA
jgi:hypothetical protein